MIIRDMTVKDTPVINRIYTDFFSENEYPNFLLDKHFYNPFIVADDHNNGKVIVAGAVKVIAEVVLVTDRDRPTRLKYNALLQALGSSIHIAKGMGFNQIHAFVHDDNKYVRVLMKHDFKVLDAELLVLDLEDSNG